MQDNTTQSVVQSAQSTQSVQNPNAQKLSTKALVLQVLRSQNASISGETLAKQIGISRVAVWKAIHALQDAGYGIVSTKNGYQLETDKTDSLASFEFGDNEANVTHFAITDSTMTFARTIAEQNFCKGNFLPHLVCADEQTNGQGQQMRKWTTTKGSLACTFVRYPACNLASVERISLATSLALLRALEQFTKKPLFLRYPNDVWSNDGKIAGLLTEVSASANFCRWMTLGIGVNLLQKPHLSGKNAVATDALFSANANVSRRKIIDALQKEFLYTEQLALSQDASLERLWNERCFDVQKKVDVEIQSANFCAGQNTSTKKNVVFKGINGWGWPVLDDDGTEKVLPPGIIRIQKR